MVWGAGGCDVDVIEHGDPYADDPWEEFRAPCREGLVQELGHCVDYGSGQSGCNASRDCADGFVCRLFDVSACVCDPRVEVGRSCATRCNAEMPCDGGRECVDGICRDPLPCLTDAECLGAQRCMDVVSRVWYVTGAGELAEDSVRRHCRTPGMIPIGGRCTHSADCASGACAGPTLEEPQPRCGTFCYRNGQCGSGEVCVQGSWGPPTCRAAPADCPGEGDEAALCRLGTWVVGCIGADDCPSGDCQFPESTRAATGYGGIGFGVGRCLEERHCGADEFRSAWRDRWSEPTCFVHVPCRSSAECGDDRSCLPVDALATTERCGRVVAP